MVAKVETETRTTGCEFAKIEIYARRTGQVKLRSYEEKKWIAWSMWHDSRDLVEIQASGR